MCGFMKTELGVLSSLGVDVARTRKALDEMSIVSGRSEGQARRRGALLFISERYKPDHITDKRGQMNIFL